MKMNNLLQAALTAVLLMSCPLAGAAAPAEKHARTGRSAVEREVRHELVMLSRYGVFDNIAFRVDGDRVILMGQVSEPILKHDAESAIKGIEGVNSIDNQIEVLPLSPMDDQIRRAVFRAIYGDTALSRYGFQAVPSIHILVKNGNVTLEGFVANEGDRNIANIRAQGVSGVFSVNNNLQIDKR